MIKKIIFITGGARSGKSYFAQELAQKFPDPKAYLATAQALDEEMAERIRRHQKNRSADWRTLEEPLKVPECLEGHGDYFSLILLDCLTLWTSNLMMAGWDEPKILEEADRLLEACQRVKCSLILVGNEVGMGIVPDNPQARVFRDLAGEANELLARAADEVHVIFSGLPLKLKG